MVKADVGELKGQMGQILEALKVLQSQGEICTSYHQQLSEEAQIFPPHGHPLNYTPPMEANLGQVCVQKAENNATTGENKLGATGFDKTIQPNDVHVNLTKQPEVRSSPHVVISMDVDNTEGKLEMLKKRLKVIEGKGIFEFSDAAGLCLVPDVVIPPKLRLPEFEKYQGKTCPKIHIIMYCRKMTAYVRDEKLLIHFFQESLTGMALNWYTHLDPTHIRSWEDLVAAFLR